MSITPEHFRDETNRRLRDHLVDGTEPVGRELELLAELDALVPEEGIDESTAKEFLLRLCEREIWDELQHADLARTGELRARLTQIQEAIARLLQRARSGAGLEPGAGRAWARANIVEAGGHALPHIPGGVPRRGRGRGKATGGRVGTGVNSRARALREVASKRRLPWVSRRVRPA